jgi:hypothetical protein
LLVAVPSTLLACLWHRVAPAARFFTQLRLEFLAGLPDAQARLSLMLELLGERNERIEQLELDVKVGGTAAGAANLGYIVHDFWVVCMAARLLGPAYMLAGGSLWFLAQVLWERLAGSGPGDAACWPAPGLACPQRLAPVHVVGRGAHKLGASFTRAMPAGPGLQEMKAIFHQQLSVAADQLHAARQQLERRQQQHPAAGGAAG